MSLGVVGQIQPVHDSWHVDISEEQIDFISFGLQDTEGILGVLGFDDIKTRFGKSFDRHHADQCFVLRYDDHLGFQCHPHHMG